MFFASGEPFVALTPTRQSDVNQPSCLARLETPAAESREEIAIDYALSSDMRSSLQHARGFTVVLAVFGVVAACCRSINYIVICSCAPGLKCTRVHAFIIQLQAASNIERNIEYAALRRGKLCFLYRTLFRRRRRRPKPQCS